MRGFEVGRCFKLPARQAPLPPWGTGEPAVCREATAMGRRQSFVGCIEAWQGLT